MTNIDRRTLVAAAIAAPLAAPSLIRSARAAGGNVLGGSTRRFDRMTRDMAQDVAISCPGIATRSVTPSALLLQR